MMGRNFIHVYLEKSEKSKENLQKRGKNIPFLYFLTIIFMLKEFRDFAMKGNVVDLAVWVIIGTAFGKIVTSLVEDIIMPVIGKLTGGLDFSNMYYAFGNPAVTGALMDAKKAGAVLAWGNFVTITLNFIIVAFCIFIIVKAMNKTIKKKPAPEAAPAGPTDVELLTEIRDLLKKKSA